MWKQLLSEAHSQASQTKLRPKNLIVLGEEGCGKTELINRIQGRKAAEDKPQGTGLEYTFIDIKDEESDDIVERMGVYTLNGGIESANLLDQLLTNELMKDTLAMLVVDFSRPWTALESLEKWSDKLVELVGRIDPEVLEQLRKSRVEAYQTYSEPVVVTEGAEKEAEEETEKTVNPMEPGTLKVNLGIPLLVVATKSDAQVKLEQDLGYRQEKLDFISLHLRNFAMKHGASLVYSGKAGKNKEVLYQAIVNAAYGTPLKIKANPDDNQGVFIPAGWDNSEKIKQLTLSFQDVTEDAQFADLIEDPNVDAAARGNGEVFKAENEQDFLTKQKQLLGKDGGAKEEAPPEPVPKPNPARGEDEKKEAKREPASPHYKRKEGAGGGKGGEPGKDVLTDFFNSLLTKKDGAGGKGGKAPPPAK